MVCVPQNTNGSTAAYQQSNAAYQQNTATYQQSTSIRGEQKDEALRASHQGGWRLTRGVPLESESSIS